MRKETKQKIGYAMCTNGNVLAACLTNSQLEQVVVMVIMNRRMDSDFGRVSTRTNELIPDIAATAALTTGKTKATYVDH